jgi:putative addiction module component (TIGR02574 family)
MMYTIRAATRCGYTMVAMNAEQLEAEALKLDPKLRARLAERLFLSLDPLSDEEWSQLWAAEAERRNTQMDADPGLGTPADEVFRKAYSKLR